MFLINGCEQDMLTASDRTTQFGDGYFTTACIIDDGIPLLAAYLERLQGACQELLTSFEDWFGLQSGVKVLAEGYVRSVLKVIISRGSGGRGYSGKNCHSAAHILSVSSWPDRYDRWRQEGITLALSPVQLGRDPLLAELKHLNRLEQVLIRSHLEQAGVDETLVLDSEGWVMECCAANLFWRKGGVVYTPRLDQAGVNDIMRQFYIRMLAQSPFSIVEMHAGLGEVIQADETIVCNTLIPIILVRACGDTLLSSRLLFDYLAPLCEHPNQS